MGVAAIEASLATETGFMQKALMRFGRHRLAVASAVVLGILITAVIVVPWVSSYSYDTIDLMARFQPPSPRHPFGTNELGQDVFIRAMYGGRISILIGIFGAISATLLGTTAGLVAGYFGGPIGEVLMRAADIMLSLPVLPLMLFASMLFRGGVLTVVAVITVFSWMGPARLVRGRVLSLKAEPFVEAAIATGSTTARVLIRHILPNSLDAIIVPATLRVGTAMLYEATLSFLGFGIQPPTPTWGNMLQRSMQYLIGMPGSTGIPWWLILFPGLAILVTVLCVNFVGDGLRDAMDPRMQ